MRHHEDGAGGDTSARPEFEEFAPQGFGAQNVERGERFVETKQFRIDGHGAGESHLLAHAPGEFARVGSFETVQADPVEQVERASDAHPGRNAPCLESYFHVLLDCQPRKQGKCLEHDSGIGIDAFEGSAAVEHPAVRGRLQTGYYAQKRALPASRGSEKHDELAFLDGDIDVLHGGKLLPARAVNLADTF